MGVQISPSAPFILFQMKSSNKRINCFKCKHFFITWEPDFPRGCHAMNFKGKEFPAVVVRRSSGKPCLLFEPKARYL